MASRGLVASFTGAALCLLATLALVRSFRAASRAPFTGVGRTVRTKAMANAEVSTGPISVAACLIKYWAVLFNIKPVFFIFLIIIISF